METSGAQPGLLKRLRGKTRSAMSGSGVEMLGIKKPTRNDLQASLTLKPPRMAKTPTVSCAAAPGTPWRSSAEPPSASVPTQATGAGSLACVCPQVRSRRSRARRLKAVNPRSGRKNSARIGTTRGSSGASPQGTARFQPPSNSQPHQRHFPYGSGVPLSWSKWSAVGNRRSLLRLSIITLGTLP